MKKFIITIILGLTSLISSPTLAGIDDVAYFNQFLFRQESHGSDPDFPDYSYRYLISNYKAMYQRADGVYVNPWISLLLLEDGSFWMQYSENYFEKPDDMHFRPGPCKIIQGYWQVPNTRLEVGDLILGDRLMVDGMNGVEINFLKDQVSPGLTSVKFDMSLGTSNSDPRQSPFCW